MRLIRLKTISDVYFAEAWALYLDAFPLEERRDLETQSSIMRQSAYHFNVVIIKKECIGFLLWWDLETYRYIDHFAASKKQRNKGFGTLILKHFKVSNDRPILLEVELPDTAINKRRIQFYERIGFKLNPYDYAIPPLKDNQAPLPLLLMSYPQRITFEDVDQFIRTCHPILFKD